MIWNCLDETVLNKDICKKCFGEHKVCTGLAIASQGIQLENVVNIFPWDKDDEKDWRRGYVNCRLFVTNMLIRTNEIPPDCHYRLEQMVTGQKDVEQEGV